MPHGAKQQIDINETFKTFQLSKFLNYRIISSLTFNTTIEICESFYKKINTIVTKINNY